MSLKECQDLVKQVSYQIQKKEVFTSSFFIARLLFEAGQVTERYLSEGRMAKDIDVDITDAYWFVWPISTGSNKMPQKPLQNH